MRSILLALLMSVALALPALASTDFIPPRVLDIDTSPPEVNPDRVIYLRDYSPNRNGVRASDCDANEVVPLACDTPGTGDDDVAKFDLAIDAACALTGTERKWVYVDAGYYRVASPIFLDCDYVSLIGPPSAVIMPTGTGVFMVKVCPQGTGGEAGSCASAPTALQKDNYIYGITFMDDDPIAHGCSNCDQYDVNPATLVGTFVYGEPVTFGTQTPTGQARFYYLSSDNATMIVTFDSGSCSTECTGTITGDLSGATITIGAGGRDYALAGEESHGPDAKNTDNFRMQNSRLAYIGDESTLLAAGSKNSWLINNFYDHVPGSVSGGAAIEATNSASDFHIIGNHIELGLGYSHKGITVSSSSEPIDTFEIVGNVISETDATASDHNTAEYGIVIDGNNDDVSNGKVTDNIVAVDTQLFGTCSVGGGFCDQHSDCGASDWCTNSADVGGSLGAGLEVTDDGIGQTNIISNMTYERNQIAGRTVLEGGGGTTRFDKNTLWSERSGRATAVEITTVATLQMNGNTIDGFGGKGIRLGAATTAVINNNTLTAIGADLWTSHQGVIELPTSATDVTFSNNNVTMDTVTAAITAHIITCNSAQTHTITDNTLVDADYYGTYRCAGTVTGNTVTDAGGIGMILNGANNTGSTYSNNIIDNSALEGIYLNGSVDDVTLTGNICEDNGTNKNAHGCIEESTSAGDTIGNRLTNNCSYWPTTAESGSEFLVGDTEVGGGCNEIVNFGAATTCSGNTTDTPCS